MSSRYRLRNLRLCNTPIRSLNLSIPASQSIRQTTQGLLLQAELNRQQLPNPVVCGEMAYVESVSPDCTQTTCLIADTDTWNQGYKL
jgi:hypothetical protein